MAKTKRATLDNMFNKKGDVQPQKKEVAPNPEPDVNTPKSVDAAKEEITPVITESYNIPSNNEESVEEISSHETKAKESEKKPPTKSSSEPKKSDIDKLFRKKKEKGEQRTIYFKKDVYEFCDGIAKKYNLGLSDVVNRLIESFLEEE